MYKNWRKICDVGKNDPLFMMFLSTVRIKSELGKRMIKAFPEYFSETETRGPVPRSVLEETAARFARRDGFEDEVDRQRLDIYGALKHFSIPVLRFATAEAVNEWDESAKPMPAELEEQNCSYMKVVKFGGHEFRVAQAVQPGELLLALVPPECIATDL